jgi:hypothetical protein
MPVPETHESDHPEPSKRNYLLKTDGSGTGTIDNPAQGAIGVVLKDPDGQLIEEIFKAGFPRYGGGSGERNHPPTVAKPT